MGSPARFSFALPAAALAAAIVTGAAAFVVGGVGTELHGGLAPPGDRALVGGPTARHPYVAERYLSTTTPYAGPTRDIACDDGSRPETVQGKVPKADYDSGRAAKGYFCNARMISHVDRTGGYRVERYVDAAGHECAYWDSTLLWPHNVPDQGTEGPGVYVMNMHDPTHPVHTDTLRTPAMQSPHESSGSTSNAGCSSRTWATRPGTRGSSTSTT
jgi:hypothetical protein